MFNGTAHTTCSRPYLERFPLKPIMFNRLSRHLYLLATPSSLSPLSLYAVLKRQCNDRRRRRRLRLLPSSVRPSVRRKAKLGQAQQSRKGRFIVASLMPWMLLLLRLLLLLPSKGGRSRRRQQQQQQQLPSPPSPCQVVELCERGAELVIFCTRERRKEGWVLLLLFFVDEGLEKNNETHKGGKVSTCFTVFNPWT